MFCCYLSRSAIGGGFFIYIVYFTGACCYLSRLVIGSSYFFINRHM